MLRFERWKSKQLKRVIRWSERWGIAEVEEFENCGICSNVMKSLKGDSTGEYNLRCVYVYVCVCVVGCCFHMWIPQGEESPPRS